MQVGDRAICIRAASKKVGCRGTLIQGAVYTITEVSDDGYLRGCMVAEVKLRNSSVHYSQSRFRVLEPGEDEG